MTHRLRYFTAVARHGSIREAAEELHVAQSALSRQIHKLEQDFGVPLFSAMRAASQLTSAGEIFLRHARSSLRQVERVRSELDALKGLRRGTINLQSIESLVPSVLPQVHLRLQRSAIPASPSTSRSTAPTASSLRCARGAPTSASPSIRRSSASSPPCSRCASRWWR